MVVVVVAFDFDLLCVRLCGECTMYLRRSVWVRRQTDELEKIYSIRLSDNSHSVVSSTRSTTDRRIGENLFHSSVRQQPLGSEFNEVNDRQTNWRKFIPLVWPSTSLFRVWKTDRPIC